ncbi:glycoside hydrolase, partial [Mucor lusitanicus]
VVCHQQDAHVPEKVIVGYWGYWESKLLPIEHIPWSQITHINYGFASVNEGIEPILTNEAQLIRMVGIAHQHNVKVLLSIGGRLGSRSMSSMAATHENRTVFVDKVVGWVLEYGLDGLDIDWEHPGKSALECNTIDYANDADNYLALLKQLRSSTAAADNGHKLLTAAVGTMPFFKNNAPIADTSHYAQVLDWIFIMMYDTYVGKAAIGPNAPLQTSMQAGASPQSFSQAWNAWTSAHMPADKIVMGLPFYGYVAKPKEDVVTLKRLLVTAHTSRPQGDPDDDLSALSSCPGAKRRGYSGLWKWRSLYTSNVLLDAKTPGGQWIKNWDQESQTPWLYNPVTRHLISYDDPDSISIKVNFALCMNARGVGIWDLAYDAYDSQGQGELLSVVNQHVSAVKKESACQKLSPVAAYKLVGPHFNALSIDRVLSRSSHMAIHKYLHIAMIFFLACMLK